MRARWPIFAAFTSLIAVAFTMSTLPSASKPWIAPPGGVRLFRFSPNDRLFAMVLHATPSLSKSRLVVIDRETGNVLIDMNGSNPTNLGFNREESLLAVLWEDALQVYELPAGNTVLKVDKHKVDQMVATRFDPQSLAFTDDSTMLIAASDRYLDPTVETAWDLRTGETATQYGSASFWYEYGLASDRSKLFGGGWPGPTPRVFDRHDGHRITYCFRAPYHIFATFTRSNLNLLTIHEDGAMFLWELRDTGNDNAVILRSELNTSLEQSLGFAILHQSDRLAYIDENRRLRYRPVLSTQTVE